MISKWVPVLLTSASVGGSIWYSLTDSEYKVYNIVNEKSNNGSGIYKKDWDILRKRNDQAFGLDKDKSAAGKVWKSSAEGNVYRDESYYVFDDWSFLNGVQVEGSKKVKFSGGERLKSYIDGVGLKVEKINDKWEYKNSGWERTRKIDVKRVLMKDGYQFEIGKGTCFLKANDKTAKDDSNLYLIIGFMKTNPKDNMSKPDHAEFVSGQESFCVNYQNNKYKIDNSKILISFDVTDGNITGNEYPILASVHGNTISPFYWRTKGGLSVNAVVLAMALKGKQNGNIDENGWEILTKEKAIKEIQKKITQGEIVERHSSKNTVGFEIRQKNGGKLKGESTEGWTANAEITFR